MSCYLKFYYIMIVFYRNTKRRRKWTPSYPKMGPMRRMGYCPSKNFLYIYIVSTYSQVQIHSLLTKEIVLTKISS